MTDKPENPPAFPCMSETAFGQETGWKSGMTLRDYFAAHAPFTFEDAANACDSQGCSEPTQKLVMRFLTQMRWHYADAMLAEREKPHA